MILLRKQPVLKDRLVKGLRLLRLISFFIFKNLSYKKRLINQRLNGFLPVKTPRKTPSRGFSEKQGFLKKQRKNSEKTEKKPKKQRKNREKTTKN